MIKTADSNGVTVLTRRLALLALCVLSAGTGARADTEPDAAMLRTPAISDSRIAFIFANQLWTAPRTGGTATPVAAPPGRSSLPRFSPDGKTIAFVGNYDGNRDIYTIPVSGGVPTRVTHHPSSETVVGWTPDGKILFYTSGLKGDHWPNRLFTVAPTGGMPEPLPMPYGVFGSINADGEWIAYSPWSRDGATWKRYRGGTAPDVWLFNLKNHQSKKITDWEGTDTQPMWGFNKGAKTVYYLSDGGPEHRLNIWLYDTETAKREQVTKFSEDDVKWPSIGPGSTDERGRGEIVFQLGPKLMVLNLDNRESKQVHITIPGARPRLRPQIKDGAEQISAYRISPSGKRVLFAARGDIFSVPVKEGTTRNLTRTSGANERFPSWSPDGKWIVYFSDADGEYNLWLQSSGAKAPEETPKEGEEKEQAAETAKPVGPVVRQPVKLTDLGPGIRVGTWWSPDSKHIAFSDNGGVLSLVTLSLDGDTPKAEVKVVDTDPWSNQDSLSFSSDSNWLAYARADEGNRNNCIWLYNIETGQKTRVTSPMFSVGDLAFDRKGDYLYFGQSREVTHPTYGDGDGAFVYAGTERLLMVPLRTDVKSPLAVKSDEEELKKDEPKKKDEAKGDDKKTDDGKKDEKKPDDAKKDDKTPDVKKPVKIDLDGFERRAAILPVTAGNFGTLWVADEGKLVYIRMGARGTEAKPSIQIFDPAADEKEEKLVVADAGSFALSDNGKKIVAKVGNKYKVLDAAAGGGKAQDVATDGLKLEVDPREEWREVFNEAWRQFRDLFYVKNMHGVNWNAMRDHYGKMIEDCANREDVNYVIGEMISELNIGHAYLWSPGDVENPADVNVGLLGADFELSTDSSGAKAYRIAAIYDGAPWDSDARGPLANAVPASKKPKVGEFILAVNGRPIDTKMDPWAAFIGLANTPTMLTVSDKAVMDASAREVLVKPVAADRPIRYRAWVERKRAYVAEKSDGKVAYVHVPNTGIDGQNELFRQFFQQNDRPAMIIDERWNGGGQTPQRFIELLNRPATNYWAVRHGHDGQTPAESHQGPKCMLINEQAGSGGDMFPWLFKHNGIGKLIGMRTWGGLVGISGTPGLIDGGAITVPDFGFYKLDGTWGVEGHGVDPDIQVVDDPALMADGGDPQLDAAIAHMLDELQKNPPKKAVRPADPDRSGMGIPEKDR